MLTQFHHFVHQFPGLIQRALVGGILGMCAHVREGALQLREDGAEVLVLDGPVAACHFGGASVRCAYYIIGGGDALIGNGVATSTSIGAPRTIARFFDGREPISLRLIAERYIYDRHG